MLSYARAISLSATEPNPSAELGDIQTRFGRRLRELRVQRGWTQLQMATDLGMDRGHICELEQGRKTVSLRTMQIFARGMKMDLSKLLEGV